MANKWGFMRLPREKTEKGEGSCLPTSLEGFYYLNTRYKCARICGLIISPGNLRKMISVEPRGEKLICSGSRREVTGNE